MMRLLTALLLCSVLSFAQAQADQSLSPSVYNALNSIQALLAEKKYDEAEAELDKLQQSLKPSFGLALTYQLHGQLHLMQEENDKALPMFQQALALDVLTPTQEAGLSGTVAQIYLMQEKYQEAIDSLEPRLQRILSLEEEHKKKRRKGEGHTRYVPAQPLITLGTAHQLKRDYRKAARWLRQGIERSENPRENWLQMLMAALYHEKDYANAVRVLDDLLRINPNKEDYWQQQAAMYQLLERQDKALQSLEAGYAAGSLQKPDNLLQLVQLLIAQQLPERGARILHKHLNDGTLELNDRNWRLLAAAWQQGRERDNAILAIREAAKLVDADKKGPLLYRAAQLSLQDANYEEVLVNAKEAVALGLPDDEQARALMLIATSSYELSDWRSARRYFQQALSHKDTAANARSWLEYLDSLEQHQDITLTYDAN